MDTVSHALAGASLSFLGLDTADPHATINIILSATFSDLDLFSKAKGGAAALRAHRTFTHSVFGMPLTAAAVAATLTAIYPDSRFLPLFLTGLAGVLLHSLLDITNSHGAQVFRGWSRRFVSWDLVAFMDPFLPFLFLAGIVLSLEFPAERVVLSGITWAVVVAYWLAKAHFRRRALKLALDGLPTESRLRIGAYPYPAPIWRWLVVFESAEGRQQFPGPGNRFGRGRTVRRDTRGPPAGRPYGARPDLQRERTDHPLQPGHAEPCGRPETRNEAPGRPIRETVEM
ncbi:MAG: metal-dependent hydrolase [Deltaproteobacteria bacterium]|nr:metal-dependent hydrolase [Deltaproteobacteria bacterium]